MMSMQGQSLITDRLFSLVKKFLSFLQCTASQISFGYSVFISPKSHCAQKSSPLMNASWIKPSAIYKHEEKSL